MAKKSKYVDISGLEKADVFRALYLAAGSVGLGAVEVLCRGLKGKSLDLSIEEAREIVCGTLRFDYFRGMRLKLDLSGDRLYVEEYNECADVPAAETIAKLRAEEGGLR